MAEIQKSNTIKFSKSDKGSDSADYIAFKQYEGDVVERIRQMNTQTGEYDSGDKSGSIVGAVSTRVGRFFAAVSTRGGGTNAAITSPDSGITDGATILHPGSDDSGGASSSMCVIS